MLSCPTAEQIQQLLSNQLDPVVQRTLEEHLQHCPTCEREIDRLLQDEHIAQWRRLAAGSERQSAHAVNDSFLERLKEQPPNGTTQPPPLLPLPPATEERGRDEKAAEPIPVSIGKYQVIRRLAAGAYGEVYEGLDREMNRPVAIKVPTAGLVQTRQAREQFLHEARSAARLRHVGVVTVHDFGQEASGRCYLVYDFVEGTNLAEKLQSGCLSPTEAAVLVAQVADALHYAHLQGLFHRDIKPANILLDRKGRPYVTDFGIAVREEDLLRERGSRSGTPHYMSPEQVRCEGHLIDGRTDVYSLGVVLYESLCGQRPFMAESLDELYDRILHREARPPRQINDAIPRELERICLKAMSKRIMDRYHGTRHGRGIAVCPHPRANASNSALIIAKDLIWSSVQRL